MYWFSVTHCDAPPPVPDYEPANWDGSPIEFNTTMAHHCQRGMKVLDDFEGVNPLPELTCREGNIWDIPAQLPTCAISK